MRYFIRSLKCLLLVAVMFSIVVLVMYYTSEHDANIKPWDLFRGNWTKIIAFFGVYAAVYPLIGYSKRTVAAGDNFAQRKQEYINLLREMNLVPEDKTAYRNPNTVKLHNKSGVIRFLRLFEDTVTLSDKEGMITIEGQRKDVVRVAMRLERYLQQTAENNAE